MKPARIVVVAVVLPVVLGVAWIAGRIFVFDWYRVPTNAMAPAIWGRHKDLVCPQCNFAFRVSASDEVSSAGEPKGPDWLVVSAVCPMCRFVLGAGLEEGEQRLPPAERGDVIFGNKLAYKAAKPQRWDVVLFPCPADPRVNYVKRVVGLPHETVRLAHGDVLIQKEGESRFRIARKPPDLAQRMLHLVYDTDYALPALADKGLPHRWAPWPREARDEPGRWQTSSDGKSFAADGSAAGEAWIRYEHRVPSYEEWKLLAEGKSLDAPPRPQLVTDYFAGNTGRDRRSTAADPAPEADSLGLHWVGDLAIGCTLQIETASGEIVLDLVEGGVPLACRIDVASGEAKLSVGTLQDFGPTAQTAVCGPGSHDVLFANVDDQLLLWIDDRLVAFDAPTTYDSTGNELPKESDLAPAGISSRGAKVQVSKLRFYRDIYYIAVRPPHAVFLSALTEWDAREDPFRPLTRERVADFISDPAGWDAFAARRPVNFPLGDGQLLVLGDNSPRSKDSRLWEQDGFQYWVDCGDLIGKVSD